jgi:uncharacterized membrane protein YhaH (DUF805 family)
MDVFLSYVLIAMLAVICVAPFARIFQRTGRTGWWAILMLIPFINVVTLWVLAFGPWPAIDETLPKRFRS